MTGKKEKIIGIIGGMGPEATIDLMQRIIRLTPALDDQDHIRCLVDNNPKIPSRINAIIHGTGEDPGPCMADMGKRLESWGADILAIACNTAHYYYDAVQDAVSIPVIHMVALVAAHVKANFPGTERIGMLASPAVAMTGLYTKHLKKSGITDIWPDPPFQDSLFHIIREIKKGNTGPDLRGEYLKVCDHLVHKKVSMLIIACTELSALNESLPVPAIDAAQVLAAELVQQAKNLN